MTPQLIEDMKRRAASKAGSSESAWDTAEKRFYSRQARFLTFGIPLWKHDLWWILHNCVAHPIIGLIPCRTAFDFHDYTSKRLMGD